MAGVLSSECGVQMLELFSGRSAGPVTQTEVYWLAELLNLDQPMRDISGSLPPITVAPAAKSADHRAFAGCAVFNLGVHLRLPSALIVGSAEEGSALPVSMQRSISDHVQLIIAMERIEKSYGRAAITSLG